MDWEDAVPLALGRLTSLSALEIRALIRALSGTDVLPTPLVALTAHWLAASAEPLLALTPRLTRLDLWSCEAPAAQLARLSGLSRLDALCCCRHAAAAHLGGGVRRLQRVASQSGGCRGAGAAGGGAWRTWPPAAFSPLRPRLMAAWRVAFCVTVIVCWGGAGLAKAFTLSRYESVL